MVYLIRECKLEDLASLVELCSAHAAYERADYDPEGKEGLLRQLLFGKDARLFCLVVEVEALVIGYASYTFDFSTWDAGKFLYMDCLYLDPACRGSGIGEVLVDKLAAIARAEGCIHMEWQTPDFNEGAIRFYQRIGGKGKAKMRFTMKLSSRVPR